MSDSDRAALLPVATALPARFRSEESTGHWLGWIAISPDSQLIAMSRRGSLKVEYLDPGSSGHRAAGPVLESRNRWDLPPLDLAFSPDGTLLALVNQGGVFLYNVADFHE